MRNKLMPQRAGDGNEQRDRCGVGAAKKHIDPEAVDRGCVKGAGGSAFYILGAAYQQMGSAGAAKRAYGNCASSGCAEASECAALAEAP